LYDETLEIILLSKIRDNIKFTTLENLKKQIQADIDNCKNNIHY
jgi:FAD synthase